MGKIMKGNRELSKPEHFIDRELSWLKFNDRVIEEAEDATQPLLERLKFLGIASSNMDEFFMVRVSGVQEQVEARVVKRNMAGLTPQEHFERIHADVHIQVDRQYRCFYQEIVPALEEEDIRLRPVNTLRGKQRQFTRNYFDHEVFPVLTPLGVDSGHPFPHLRNLSLNVAVRLKPPKNSGTLHPLFAVVQVPQVLDRLVRLPNSAHDRYDFILLEDLIATEIALLFPGMSVMEVAAFRVIRDADIDFAEEEADDLLKTIEEELRKRERGSAVRLSIESRASDELLELLMETVNITKLQVYKINGPLNLAEVAKISSFVDRPDLKDAPFTQSLRDPLRGTNDLYGAIAKQDILMHHPYESFSPVEDFVSRAANDPDVLAIKQTLYRTSGDSPISRALMEAAENGKQVAALVELKARFDEERNIDWARKMEKAGVHVVYGLIGLKTHAKVCLIVRREAGGIRRYVHLGTGNYNSQTARFYTDLGLFTCDPDLCDDATELFNLLTGYSRMSGWKKMIVAPLHLRSRTLEMIDDEIAKAKAGKRARIRAKMNSLVDEEMICKLYEASNAGVKVRLIVRGICCLRPGVKGLSENIEVSSIVDRFLEHSRIYIFGEREDKKVYLSSADWMTRNLDRRVETLFPVENPVLKNRVVNEIFKQSEADNVKRRILQSDGTYVRAQAGAKEPLRIQANLLKLEETLRLESRQNKKPEILPQQFNQSKQGPGSAPPLPPIIPAARSRSIKTNAEIIQLSVDPKDSTPLPILPPEPQTHEPRVSTAKKTASRKSTPRQSAASRKSGSRRKGS